MRPKYHYSQTTISHLVGCCDLLKVWSSMFKTTISQSQYIGKIYHIVPHYVCYVHVYTVCDNNNQLFDT
jgi:hypothetical protein